jgi:hypothetical protein
MCDKLVYDLAQEVEGSPSVFIRKDWINILDNQNQSYVSNQSVLDTSQLSNSNKWMSYREAYFSVPLTITLGSTGLGAPTGWAAAGAQQAYPGIAGNGLFEPTVANKSADFAVGLKNWFGNIIHSFTLDYNGTTIIQQTPFVNMWNSFKLMTSLSYQDVITQGCTIGFYPDDCESWEFYDNVSSTGGVSGIITAPAMNAPAGGGIVSTPSVYIPGTGTCNNTDAVCLNQSLDNSFTRFKSGLGNEGFLERQKWISFDLQAIAGTNSNPRKYGNLISGGLTNAADASSVMTQIYKGYIFNRQNQVGGASGAQTTAGIIQYAVMATIYLKHIHSFFNMIPLLKGAFMKMTMNLNNTTSTIHIGTAGTIPAATGADSTPQLVYTCCEQVQSALGGSNMLMLASANVLYPYQTTPAAGALSLAPGSKANGSLGVNGAYGLLGGSFGVVASANAGAAGIPYLWDKQYRMNLSVGSVCLDSTLVNGGGVQSAPLSKSVFLYIPAYTFNPTFEQAYLSSPVKQIKYTDIYQYQVLNVAAGQPINNLLTNGISNVKSVLILPFYSTTPRDFSQTVVPSVSISQNTGFTLGYPVWQSPFDPAGCGATSPLSHITNFNIQVSGQNAIYNLQKYNFEQFNNQLYGQNAVNGGLTDGITSSLIDRQAFDLEYCYYYVNIERMLPVEQSVPKSIQFVGTNVSSRVMDYICFIEYGTEVSIDALTGARV